MRVNHIRTLLVAAVLVPSLALAQRGGGRGRSDDTPAGPRTAPQRPMPTARDIEEMNPASLLVDKRKKIGLADETVSALKTLAASIKERNKSALSAYDSVRRKVRPSNFGDKTSQAPSTAEQQDMRQAMTAMRQIVQSLRAQRIVDTEETMKLVADETQKQKAIEFLKDQDEDFDKMLPGGRGDRTNDPTERKQ
jgi:hypothetical protein